MKIKNISKYTRGWFIGHFTPTLFNTKDFEVGIKWYKKGDKERPHFHKIATELTTIITGKFSAKGKIVRSGDMIVVKAKEVLDFSCLEDGATVVVKIPSNPNDKFYIKEAYEN